MQLLDANYYRREAEAVTTLRVGGAVALGAGAALGVLGFALLPRTGGSQVALLPTGTGATLVGSF